MKNYVYYRSTQPNCNWNFCGEVRPCDYPGKVRIQVVDVFLLCAGVWSLGSRAYNVDETDCHFYDTWEEAMRKGLKL